MLKKVDIPKKFMSCNIYKKITQTLDLNIIPKTVKFLE